MIRRFLRLILFVPLTVICAVIDCCIYPFLLIKWVIDGKEIVDPPFTNLVEKL